MKKLVMYLSLVKIIMRVQHHHHHQHYPGSPDLVFNEYHKRFLANGPIFIGISTEYEFKWILVALFPFLPTSGKTQGASQSFPKPLRRTMPAHANSEFQNFIKVGRTSIKLLIYHIRRTRTYGIFSCYKFWQKWLQLVGSRDFLAPKLPTRSGIHQK